MQRLTLSIIALLVLATSAGIAVYHFTFSGNDNTPMSAQPANSRKVLLYHNRAVPDIVAIQAGETVEFASANHASHSLSLGGGDHPLATGSGDDGHRHQHIGDFSSGQFAPDEAWLATFQETGRYELHDHLHPKLRVTVVVYQVDSQ